MRWLYYIQIVTILLFASGIGGVVLSPVECAAQRQRTIERSTMPDTLCRTYRHSEAVKYLAVARDTANARSIWQELVAQDTTYAPALYNLYLIEKDRDKALDYAERAYMADTTNKWYAHAYASSLVQARRYTQAIPAYRRLMRLSPKDIESYHALAILYSYGGMPYSAIAILDSAELRTSYNPYLSEIKLDLLIDTRQYDKAVEAGKRVVAEYPYDAKARINLAKAYEVAGRDSLARTTLDEAYRIDSTNIETLTAISMYYERKGNAQRMLDYEERIIDDEQLNVGEKLRRVKLFTSNRAFYAQNYIRIGGIIQRIAIAHPNNRKVVDCYAEHMIALGELDAALDYMRRHLDNEATTPAHYIEVLQLEHYLKREEEMFEDMQRGIDRYPTSKEIFSFMGFLASERKSYDLAVEIFSDCLKVCDNDTDRSEMLGYIGDVYHEMGKDNKAFKAYRKALAFNADNIVVLNNYAYFLSILDKDLDQALEMSKRAIELEPNNATYVDTYAWVLHRLGRNEEAKRAMSQALSLSSQRDASLLVHYADILWALGEKFMADTYWKKAAELGFDREALDEHIAELKSNTR